MTYWSTREEGGLAPAGNAGNKEPPTPNPLEEAVPRERGPLTDSLPTQGLLIALLGLPACFAISHLNVPYAIIQEES